MVDGTADESDKDCRLLCSRGVIGQKEEARGEWCLVFPESIVGGDCKA